MSTLNTEASEAGNVVDEHLAVHDADYWNSLISELEAAEFLGLARGTVANYRQAGTGARFVRISARCIKYRRHDLKAWCDDRLRSSTSDLGPDKAAA